MGFGSPRPGRAEFEQLAHRYPIVPVWREIFADLHTPLGAYRAMARSLRDSFLLESVEGGERWGRYSFIGGDSLACVRARDGDVSIEGSPPVAPEPGEPPLSYLRRLMLACRAPAIEGLPPLHGGAVGYLGYDCVRELERLPSGPPDDLSLPDLVLLLTRSFVVFDHFAQRLFVISNVPSYLGTERAYQGAVDRCDEVVTSLLGDVDRAPAALEVPEHVEFRGPVSDEEYASWVEAARSHIYAGDIFQVVPSRRFEVELKGSPVDAYRLLRTLNPSPYMYLLRFGASNEHPAFDIAGSSPEPLVRVTGDRVEARPIAGTRPRGATRARDLALEQELISDAKERAEHVMLVDLARNDVGRVAQYGSVRVEELMTVERYSHVMHLVSSVVGRLSSGASAFDALTSSFPAGTVTGAPKVRAMQIIDSLEKTRRGPYAGVVGYFDFSGNIDTCITIRTMVATGGRAYVQAGAGIVADSIPGSEVEETRRKAEVLLRAAGAQAPGDGETSGPQPS